MIRALFGAISLGTVGSIVIFLFVFGAVTYTIEPLNIPSLPILIFSGTLICCIVAGFIFKHFLPVLIVALLGSLVYFLTVLV